MALWLIQVLASATSPEQVPIAETFFLIKKQRVPGLMSLKLMSTEALLYWFIWAMFMRHLFYVEYWRKHKQHTTGPHLLLSWVEWENPFRSHLGKPDGRMWQQWIQKLSTNSLKPQCTISNPVQYHHPMVRTQVANTRPIGRIQPSTLFYPARHLVSTRQQCRALI